jgi:hypothetical protein
MMKKLTSILLVMLMGSALAGCYTKSCNQMEAKDTTVSYKETK